MTTSIKVSLRNKNGGETAFHRIGLTERYEKWWVEFGSADLRRVYENFGMEVFRRSSCLDGFSSFLQRSGFTGERCLEIGTCHGLTAIVLSRLFKEVISIDVEPRPIKHELAAFCGIKNIRFFDVSDNSQKAEIVRRFGNIDAAYCDGDHTHDAQSDFDLVRHCGRVAFHEYWPLQPQVWELVNGLGGSIVSHSNYAIWTR